MGVSHDTNQNPSRFNSRDKNLFTKYTESHYIPGFGLRGTWDLVGSVLNQVVIPLII